MSKIIGVVLFRSRSCSNLSISSCNFSIAWGAWHSVTWLESSFGCWQHGHLLTCHSCWRFIWRLIALNLPICFVSQVFSYVGSFFWFHRSISSQLIPSWCLSILVSTVYASSKRPCGGSCRSSMKNPYIYISPVNVSIADHIAYCKIYECQILASLFYARLDTCHRSSSPKTKKGHTHRQTDGHTNNRGLRLGPPPSDK